jgi:hypothetical protein
MARQRYYIVEARREAFSCVVCRLVRQPMRGDRGEEGGGRQKGKHTSLRFVDFSSSMVVWLDLAQRY